MIVTSAPREPFDLLKLIQVSPLGRAMWSPAGHKLKETDPELAFPMKVPPKSTIEYGLAGQSRVEPAEEGLRFRHGAEPFIVWRSCRVVPKQFSIQ